MFYLPEGHKNSDCWSQITQFFVESPGCNFRIPTHRSAPGCNSLLLDEIRAPQGVMSLLPSPAPEGESEASADLDLESENSNSE